MFIILYYSNNMILIIILILLVIIFFKKVMNLYFHSYSLVTIPSYLFPPKKLLLLTFKSLVIFNFFILWSSLYNLKHHHMYQMEPYSKHNSLTFMIISFVFYYYYLLEVIFIYSIPSSCSQSLN